MTSGANSLSVRAHVMKFIEGTRVVTESELQANNITGHLSRNTTAI